MDGDHLWVFATGEDDLGGLLTIVTANSPLFEQAVPFTSVAWATDADLGVVEAGYYWAMETGNGVVYAGDSPWWGPLFYNP